MRPFLGQHLLCKLIGHRWHVWDESRKIDRVNTFEVQEFRVVCKECFEVRLVCHESKIMEKRLIE